MDNQDDIIPEVIQELKAVTPIKRKATRKNISPDKFIDLVSKEYSSIRRCNKTIRKLEKFIFSDEFIFALEAKDLLKLMEVLLKYKNTSLSFLAKLYEVSTKNDVLRSYFEEKIDSKIEEVKQDARIRNIVNQIKSKAKQTQLEEENKNDES
jgi:hypothetical protein